MLSRCYKRIAALWAGIMRAYVGIGKYISSFKAKAFKAILRTAFARKGEIRTTDIEELDEAIEVTGFSYDSEQDIFYSDMDAWQRDFGYCRLYDEAAAIFGMIVDAEPIYFEYGGKRWLIELWKGQYDLTTGCEIGVYTTEGPALNIPGAFNATFYESGSHEDLLHMSCVLKKNHKSLFTREDKHWWLTGFKLGEFSEPWELTMEASITLKDRIMCNAFVKGLNNAGYSDNEIITYGNTVSLKFDKPKTPQPITRTKATDWLIQRKNNYLCDKFQDITGTNNTMQEKLRIIQQKSPRLYKKILNMGKTQSLYKRCRTINNYLK